MKIVSILLVMLLTASSVFAAADLNVTRQGEDQDVVRRDEALANLRVTNIRQDPFPVNPGEYVTLYFKVENTGGDVQSPHFELVLPYPLSVYPEEDRIVRFPVIESGERLSFSMRVKVDEQGLPGDYEGEMRAYISQNNFYPYFFDINVEDVTADFDLAVQDVLREGISVAIANTGKNNANSITIDFSDQQDFNLLGTSSYIIGNLDTGDYTLVNLLAVPEDENDKELLLRAKISYTDILGNRRMMMKTIPIAVTPKVGEGFTELTGYATTSDEEEEQGSFNIFLYTTLILALALVIIVIRQRRKRKAEE